MLPPGIIPGKTKPKVVSEIFQQKLKLIWADEPRNEVFLLKDAFLDNSVQREEVIHKIVEVKVLDDEFARM